MNSRLLIVPLLLVLLAPVGAVLDGVEDAGAAQTNVCGPNPSPPDSRDPAIRVTAPTPGAAIAGPLRVMGQARVFEATVSLELKDAGGGTIARGSVTAGAGAPALAAFEGALAFTVSRETPACLWVYEESARDGTPRNVVQVGVTLLSAPAPAFTEAALNLTDPRPCIPEAGQRRCDATREALWNGDAGAWAARGVTNPDQRFVETVVFRVRAGDPAAIANIARALGSPYLKITRVVFGFGADFAEVTNLGGGAQEMTGWTLRSPERDRVFRFPEGFVLGPGESRGVCGACVPSCPLPAPGTPPVCPTPNAFQRGFGTPDVFPDEEGRVVLFFDALNLPGDDTRYSADPNNQPPPPNLQGVRSGPQQPAGPLAFVLTTSKPDYAPGELVQFQMTLTNTSGSPQMVTLPSGQDFDVAVSDESGRAVWRWSSGRVFTLALRLVTIAAGETRTFTASWDQQSDDGARVPAGVYRATELFPASPPLSSEQVTFSIGTDTQPRRQTPDVAGLIDRLSAAGATVAPGDDARSPIFTPAPLPLLVNGEPVQVFEYADEGAASADLARLSPDAGTYRRGAGGPVINVSWIAPPHVYRSGPLIVLYVGSNADLLRILEAVLGPPVAGG